MCYKRTILSLFVIAAAMVVCAQQMHTDRLRGEEPTDVSYHEQRTPLPKGQQRDSLVRVRTLELRAYVDTLRTITQTQDYEPDPNHQPDMTGRRGHHVQVQLGAGLGAIYGGLTGSLAMQQPSKESAGISALVQLQYAYYFHPHWGFGIGAWITNYTSHGSVTGEYSFSGPDVIDTDNEVYIHRARIIGNWRELQMLHVVALPISLQAQTWGKRNKAGFFFDLGVAPGYAVMHDYRVTEGKIEHYGVYEHRGFAELHDAHEFMTIDYMSSTSSDIKTKGSIAVKPLITPFLDLGLLLRMGKHADFLLGLYGQYTANNIQNATLQDIGWKDSRFPNADMPGYNGLLATKQLADNGALRPWEAGVKVGIHWHSGDKPRMLAVNRVDTTLQTVERLDSTWIEYVDTIRHITATERIQRQVDKLNRIYFTFDSYQINEESKLFLDHIAEQLKTISNKVIIGGHASKEGTRQHNHRLALNRAKAVREYLISRGVQGEQLLVRDYGSSMPNAINRDQQLSLDRRVEIIVLGE